MNAILTNALNRAADAAHHCWRCAAEMRAADRFVDRETGRTVQNVTCPNCQARDTREVAK